jgi:dGTPase
MLLGRKQQEADEIERLAPYAVSSARSRGRDFKETSHPLRTEFQRDRDRIIHSRAFRRLEYKTQVFLNGTGDHYRTRLTHTMEVAAISRTIARALRLNEDLTEAIALAHDLGHSPFGHSGEHTLNELMQGDGGFEHNRQSLRVVEMLEERYPAFEGLNLTFEVREGLKKHNTPYDHPDKGEAGAGSFHSPNLEGQVANLADEITYYSHDLDDGLESGLISEKQVLEIPLWGTEFTNILKEQKNLGEERRRYHLVRCVIDTQVHDVINESRRLIEASGVRSVDEVRNLQKPLIQTTESLAKRNRQLRKFLYSNLYFSKKVRSANLGACEMIKGLFEFYAKNSQALGKGSRARVTKHGLKRAVCDYIAGMTDRFVIQSCRQHGIPTTIEGRP